MDLDLNKEADMLIKVMQTHSEKEVKNKAILNMNKLGYVKENLGNNLYIVVIDDEEYKMGARTGLLLNEKDIVIVMLFNGDLNRPWIIDKKTWSCW